ncbi:hypothetical protein [Epilithonimonas sp.]|uniref:hypothetical protein n=1 Tax=Epilithonimonas sp. TaxID=2894511 RepID=UPI002FDD5226
MKSLTLTGIVLILIAFVLFYFNDNFTVMRLFEPITLMGILFGVGIGLIFGGLIGYVSKGNAVKQAKIQQEFKLLQKEKAELERQKSENINNGNL